MKKYCLYLIAIILLTACTQKPDGNVGMASRQPEIYPDYTDVTIPQNIAPMNFLVREEGCEAVQVEVNGDDDGSQNDGEEISANYNDEPGSHVLTPSGTITIGDTAYPTYTDETGTTWIKGSDGNYYTQAYYEANT